MLPVKLCHWHLPTLLYESFLGGGRAFAWRVLDVQYTRSWMPPVDPINAQQGVQVRTGVVLRIGTW